MHDTDRHVWSRALALAKLALNLSQPNPRVGCLITAANGALLGEGYTQQAGGPHAEVMALRDVLARGECPSGSTVYVTLEPCSHHGRTPPCCDALVAAGVARVVVACIDPNPLVAGRGVEQLRAAGITVDVLPTEHDAAQASRELNIGFFSRMTRGIPWVRIKVAASLDGITALPNGSSQWITGEAARQDGHAWRARACAVLTGIGTVLKDDPMLDVRGVPIERQPHLILIDSRLETPPSARLFSTPVQKLARQILIYTASRDVERTATLEAKGASIIHCADQHMGAESKVNLRTLLQDLAKRQVNELHIEAGHQLNGALLRENLVDECLFYIAPTLLDQGNGIAHFGSLQRLSDGVALAFQSIERVGEDLRVLARVRTRGPYPFA